MQPGTLVAGKYRVERVIGRGGMGLVVEATHIHLGHRVALKFLAEEMVSEQTAVARFNREARASAQLKSEHICHVADFGIEGKTPYIVMELLSGTDLARLAKVRVLDVPTAALYIRQACLGLAEAHQAGIIHRDLKPGNLFLTRRSDGTPLIKVLDFGVAKAPTVDNEKLTGTANVVGSPGFMSPEQFRSSKSVDGRTDIWSLGVILYKLVSGRLPFKADGFAEFALAITRDPTPPLAEAPPPFAAVVARCLEKDPNRRYATVTQLAEALAPFAAHARPSAGQMTVPPTEPNDLSGIGGADGPDTGNHTQLVGGGVPNPKPAIARVPALVKVPAPSGVAAVAPIHGTAVPAPAPAPIQAAPPSGDAKRTMLGVSTPTEKAKATGSQPVNVYKPTVAETAVQPAQTISGTAVGTPGKLYVLTGELPTGTVVGEYRIDGKIGEGGMGVVYSATHPLIGKRAAIKVIAAGLGSDPVVVERFVQEARSVNQIGHPNIVDVFAFGKLPDGRNYFVMEHLQGESLRARLYRSFMSIPDAIQILDEITAALEAAHEKGIVHRDLKPDNVFLASVRGGLINVKLLDFGIAKLAVPDGGIAKTSTGEMIGTPAYLSPEQARGKNVDFRTDIYALGVMMYEMITGRIPFIAESAMDIVMMHITQEPQKPSIFKPDIPVLLEQTILQMLAKDPMHRPTLAHVRNIFAELVATGQVQLEASSTSTFRSDLKSRPASSPKNQVAGPQTPRGGHAVAEPSTNPGMGAAPPSGAQTLPHGASRRHSPSEAPTAIQFNPGADTITPSDNHKTGMHAAAAPKSRVGLAIALVLLAAVGSAVTVIAIVKPGGDKSAAGSAGSAVATVPGDAVPAPVVPADAAVVAQAVDAAVAADATVSELREVTITANVPTAKIEVDGTPAPVKKGVAVVKLADGAHHVVISASGRVTVDTQFDVSESRRTLDVKLDKARKQTTPTGQKQQGSGGGSATTPTPPAGQGSGSARRDPNGTIDPF